MNRIKVVHTRAILGALEREGSDFRNGSPPPLVFYVGSLNVGYPACLVSPALRFRMTTVVELNRLGYDTREGDDWTFPYH